MILLLLLLLLLLLPLPMIVLCPIAIVSIESTLFGRRSGRLWRSPLRIVWTT